MTKFHFDISEGSRGTIQSVTSTCAVMTVMTPRNLKFVDLTKTKSVITPTKVHIAKHL